MQLRIRILRQTAISGEVARVGDVIDADRYAAEVLVRMGKAELVAEAEPIAEEPAPEAPAPTRKPRTRRTR